MFFAIKIELTGGDLFDAITRVTRFPESEARIMVRHLASAMAYLHSLSIVHRDIKPENLLVELDEVGHVTQLKLADFGLACEVTEPLTAVCGTPTYVAPEILMETGYGLKVTLYAILHDYPKKNADVKMYFHFVSNFIDRRLGGRYNFVHIAMRIPTICIARQRTRAIVRCNFVRCLRISRALLE